MTMSKFIHLCDCGAVAYKKDGSGWFCRECEIEIEAIRIWLEARIHARRMEESEMVIDRKYVRRENSKRWRRRNRDKVNKKQNQVRKKLRKLFAPTVKFNSCIQAHKLSNSLARVAV